MARPPSRGIGTTCTSRSRASCMAPARIGHPPDQRRQQVGDGGRHQQSENVLAHRSPGPDRMRRPSRCNSRARLRARPMASAARSPPVPRTPGDLPEPADRDRALAQQPGHVAGEVHDRGGLAAGRAGRRPGRPRPSRRAGPGPAAAVVAAGRAGQVGAADGHRAGLPQQVQRRPGPAASGPPRCPLVSPRSQLSVRGRPAHDGQAARPELVDELLPVRPEVLDQGRRGPDDADQDRRRHVPAAALGRQQRGSPRPG